MHLDSNTLYMRTFYLAMSISIQFIVTEWSLTRQLLLRDGALALVLLTFQPSNYSVDFHSVDISTKLLTLEGTLILASSYRFTRSDKNMKRIVHRQCWEQYESLLVLGYWWIVTDTGKEMTVPVLNCEWIFISLEYRWMVIGTGKEMNCTYEWIVVGRAIHSQDFLSLLSFLPTPNKTQIFGSTLRCHAPCLPRPAVHK